MTTKEYKERILCVDDSPLNLRLLTHILAREGYEILEAADGEACLRILDNEPVDLVLLDVVMPVVDGYEVCRRIKAAPGSRDVPVIFITAQDDDQDEAYGLSLGAIDYLTKPFNPALLTVRVRNHLQVYEARRQIEAAREKERQFESRIEQMLLSERPPVAVRGAEIEALSVPSRHMDGDFIDFYTYDDRCFDVVVGDVMGKGLQAALINAGAKSLFHHVFGFLTYKKAQRCIADGRAMGPPDPVRMVTLVNRELAGRLMALERFITLCYARVDLNNRVLSFVDCGHTHIIVYRAQTGRCEMLKGDNMPLGFLLEQEFRLCETPLHAGDRILLYSDGVSEARNPDGEQFGEHRLCEFLENLPDDVAARDIPGRLQSTVEEFTAQRTFADDFSCNIISLDPDYVGYEAVTIPGELQCLEHARACIRRVLQTAWPGPQDELMPGLIEVAVQEAVVNIMEHEFRGRKDSIDIEAVNTGQWIRIRLYYPGRAFDIDAVAPLDFEAQPPDVRLADGGRGVHIMRTVMDECRCEQVDLLRSCITLVKYLR